MANYKQLSWTQLQTVPPHEEVPPESTGERRPKRPLDREVNNRQPNNRQPTVALSVNEQANLTVELEPTQTQVVGSLELVLETEAINEQIVPEPVSTPDQRLADAQGIWKMMQSELSLQIPSATYDTWVRDTWVVAYKDGEFTVGVPHAYARDWLTNRLRGIIKRTLGGIVKRSVQVNFQVDTQTDDEKRDSLNSPRYQSQPRTQNFSGNHPRTERNVPPQASRSHPNGSRHVQAVANSLLEPRGPSRVESTRATDLVHQEIAQRLQYQELPEKGRKEKPFREKAIGEQTTPDRRIEIEADEANESQLNRQYTFDSFVVGRHNQLAHAAALAIAEKPGQQFNPFFIYGGVGLGKTHLLNAIGNRLKDAGYRTLCCSSEQFTNELVGAIRRKETGKFRDKYRALDVLLIDDIQFFSGKESTQEEFFHTFNHLQAAGSQIVVSGEQPPNGLTHLKERLRSRFEGGLQADIAQPDFEARLAILEAKAAKTKMPISTEVLAFVAERVDSNIRELEGILNRLLLQCQFTKRALTPEVVGDLLEVRTVQKSYCETDTIIDIVAAYFHLRPEDIIGKGRANRIVYARQIAMYLMREVGNMSLPAIGKKLGGRDHSTIRHGAEKISRNYQSDESLRRDVTSLRQQIL